jgi:pimeloyl-ACP methyl ester carboxylesterase
MESIKKIAKKVVVSVREGGVWALVSLILACCLVVMAVVIFRAPSQAVQGQGAKTQLQTKLQALEDMPHYQEPEELDLSQISVRAPGQDSPEVNVSDSGVQSNIAALNTQAHATQTNTSDKLAITQPLIKVGEYGGILNKSNTYIKNAVADNVVIYSKKSHDSQEFLTRKGLVVRYKKAKATILISHGFMCDKYWSGFLRNVFPQGAYNFMTFDFRAHGEDKEGQQCTLGRDEAHDVIAAAKFLREHPDLKGVPVIAYGFSMGAAAAIGAQSQDSSLFDAMILDCPFASTERVIKMGLDKMKLSLMGYEFEIPGKSFLEKYAYHPYVQSMIKVGLKVVANMDTQAIETNIQPFSPVESIKKVTVPCFFIHCKKDEKVSIESVKEIYDGAGGYKKLWLTQGRGHFDSVFYSPERYAQQVRDFLQQALMGVLKHGKADFEEDHEVAINQAPGISQVQNQALGGNGL